MHTWDIARKNLWRRPFRSGLAAVGLAVSVTAVVALVGVSESLESSFLDLYTRRGADLVVQRRGGAAQLSKGIARSVGDRIRALPGVREVIAGLMDMVSFEDHDLFMVIVNGWEADCPVFERVTLLAGRRLRSGDGRNVMLGRILADNLGKRVGDRITIYGQEFNVVGIFASFSVYENGAVFMLLDELQRQMDRPGEVTGFVVQAADKGAEAIAAIQRQIESLDPEIAATPCAEFVNSLAQMKLARSMSWFTALFAVVIGGIGMMNTLAMTVFERRGEIATLRAMGWRSRRVVGLVISESLLLAAAGAVSGVLLGIGLTLALSYWKKTAGLVQGDVSVRAIVEGTIIAAVIAVLGAWWPAWRCARLPPGDTLRSH